MITKIKFEKFTTFDQSEVKCSPNINIFNGKSASSSAAAPTDDIFDSRFSTSPSWIYFDNSTLYCVLHWSLKACLLRHFPLSRFNILYESLSSLAFCVSNSASVRTPFSFSPLSFSNSSAVDTPATFLI